MIKFKTRRVDDEFRLDKIIRQELKDLIYMLSLYCEIEFGKDITVTELYRTQREQESYYKHIPGYNKKSVHTYGRGADIRSRNFTDDEVTKIVGFLNMVTYLKGSKYNTCKYHDIGMGSHFHLQVPSIQ